MCICIYIYIYIVSNEKLACCEMDSSVANANWITSDQNTPSPPTKSFPTKSP